MLTGDEVRRAERGPHGKHGVLAHAKLRHFALDGDAVFGKVSAMRRVHLFGFTRTRAELQGKHPGLIQFLLYHLCDGAKDEPRGESTRRLRCLVRRRIRGV